MYESIIGDQSAHDAVLKDVQIGDTYIKLVKDTLSFSVKMGSAPIPTKVKYKQVFNSKHEDRARKYFEKLKNKIIAKMGVCKNERASTTRTD